MGQKIKILGEAERYRGCRRHNNGEGRKREVFPWRMGALRVRRPERKHPIKIARLKKKKGMNQDREEPHFCPIKALFSCLKPLQRV
uniref:Uncharacterized protein n=1 Tax=Arundo donax TaxID=35708 RepID=A0A0A8ZEG4_ARUDO